jgi:endonuclease III
MATFTEKARRLTRVCRVLKRHYGEPIRSPVTHSVEHVVRTILSEEASSEQVEKALERLRRQFVDWNDLRVSRPREIREVLGADYPGGAEKARVIPRLLDQVFKRHNSMVWDFLEEMGKLEGRAYFEALEEVRPFVAATIARDFLDAHAFPVDRDVARVLGRLGVLEPDSEDEAQMQSVLERAVKSPHAWEAHWLVKRLAEDFDRLPADLRKELNRICPEADLKPPKPAPKKAKKSKKKARKKTKKKKAKRSKKSGSKKRKKKKAKRKSAKRKRRKSGR